MLYIVASYRCMQFQRKLMNQTWENGNEISRKTTKANSTMAKN